MPTGVGCQQGLATLRGHRAGTAGAQGRHPCREQRREPGATALLHAVESSSSALSVQALRVREKDLQRGIVSGSSWEGAWRPEKWVHGAKPGSPACKTLLQGLPPLCTFIHTGAGGDGCGPISVPRSWAWRGLESSEQGFNAASSPLGVFPALEGGSQPPALSGYSRWRVIRTQT